MVEDVACNELLMFKVSIQGYFDNTNSPIFVTKYQILNNYAMAIFQIRFTIILVNFDDPVAGKYALKTLPNKISLV